LIPIKGIYVNDLKLQPDECDNVYLTVLTEADVKEMVKDFATTTYVDNKAAETLKSAKSYTDSIESVLR